MCQPGEQDETIGRIMNCSDIEHSPMHLSY